MGIRTQSIKFFAPAVLPVFLVWMAVCHIPYSAVVSLLAVLLALVPFFWQFERSRPRPRDLVPIAVMSAIGALSRAAFAALPSFKPTSAIVIITGMQFGPQAGFLTGALSAFASNMFLGQGPWTPWQMYAWGMIGFMSGVLGKRQILNKQWVLLGFGMAAGVLFGWFMNLQYIVSYVNTMDMKAVLLSYAASAPMDITHGVSTVLFLLLLAKPWGKKLKRLKIKYGILEEGSYRDRGDC